MEHMIPSVLEIREHKCYLRRITALQACSMIASVIDEDTAKSDVLPIILEMAYDAVSELWRCISVWILLYLRALAYVLPRLP